MIKSTQVVSDPLSFIQTIKVNRVFITHSDSTSLTYIELKHLIEHHIQVFIHYYKFSQINKVILCSDDPSFILASLWASFYTPVSVIVISSTTSSEKKEDLEKQHKAKIFTEEHFNHKIQESFSEYHFNPLHSFFLLSSGTTGTPKLIPLNFNNIYISVTTVIETYLIDQEDVSFLNLPIHHIGGLMVIMRAFYSKGRITLNAADKYQILSLVPTQLSKIFNQEDKKISLNKLENLKILFIGGGLLEEDLKNKAKRYKLPIIETYGMTESSSMVLGNGKALNHAEVKLDSKNRIMIKSKSLSPYLRENNLLDHDGFYTTNDIGEYRNHHSTIHFLKRSDLLIKSGGEFIDPLEIEAILNEFKIKAYATSIKHPKWNEALTLLVYRPNLVNTDTIITLLKEKLSSFKIPKIIIHSPLDYNIEGIKINRVLLKENFKNLFFKNLFPTSQVVNSQTSSNSILFIFHGFMEDKSDWQFLADNLSSHSDYKKIIRIDLYLHGQSQLNEEYNLTRSEYFYYLKEFVLSFIDETTTLDFIGYSMGGRVVRELFMLMKIEERKKINSLNLISTHLGFKSTESFEITSRKQNELELFDNIKDHHSFFTKWYKQSLFNNYDQHPHFKTDLDKKVKYSFLKWKHSLEYFSSTVSEFHFESFLHELEKSTSHLHLICGDKDEKYTKMYQNFCLIHKNNIQLTILKNAAHNIHKTHAAELVVALRDKPLV